MAQQKGRRIAVAIEVDDVLAFRADVLAVKYAQALYGVDAAVFSRIMGGRGNVKHLLPPPRKCKLVESGGRIDVFHYGIQGVVNAAGYLREHADISSFTGDIVEWIKERIAPAALVIADLSMANADVYLEVGFAWGRNKPTLLLVRDLANLKFDVKGHRCIVYKKIKDLEDALRKELALLKKGH